MGLSRRDAERLVMLAGSDETLYYRDIHKALPNLSNEAFSEIINDDFTDAPYAFMKRACESRNYSDILLVWVQCPTNYTAGYIFQPDDRFVLTRKGSDIRYEVEKERKQNILVISTLAWTIISATIAVISLLVSVWHS